MQRGLFAFQDIVLWPNDYSDNSNVFMGTELFGQWRYVCKGTDPMLRHLALKVDLMKVDGMVEVELQNSLSCTEI